MTRRELDLANAALAISLSIKAHVPGDVPEDHEDNTFGLPNGVPLRRKLRRFFRDQLKRMVGFVARIGAKIPKIFPRMADYDDPMASAMTPILGVYWDKAGKALRGRLGLDEDEWRVTDPNVHKAIAAQSFKFCKATNETTDREIGHAVEALRKKFAEGLIGDGQTIPELTKAVQSIFTRASKSRAEMIARSETSRAVHAAAEMSAEGSGVVSAKKWLLSANSCPVCVALAAKTPQAPLGGSFGKVGNDAEYSNVRVPPAHPNCRCSITFVLIDEGVPHAPAFAPKPAPPEPEDGRSKAKVEFEGDKKETLKVVGKVFGKRMAGRDLAGLAGAPDGAKVVLSAPYDWLIRADVIGDDCSATRAFHRDEATGKLIIDNESLFISKDARGKGLGASIFGRQVKAGINAGASAIQCEAARGEGMNGYYTWPRFGYDAPIPEKLRATLPAGLRNDTHLSDLMGTESGRDWWKSHGITTEVEFDLAKGSLSREIWDGYLDAKREAAKSRTIDPAEDADFTAEDLAIAARIWDSFHHGNQ